MARLLFLPVTGVLWFLVLWWGLAGVFHALSHDIAGALLGIQRERSLGTGPELWRRGTTRVSGLPGAFVNPSLDRVAPVRAILYLLSGPAGSLFAAWLLVATPAAIEAMVGLPETVPVPPPAS